MRSDPVDYREGREARIREAVPGTARYFVAGGAVTITLLAGVGAIACLVLLAVLAIISQVSENETPDFVYLVGLALAVAAWLMLAKAGL